MVTNLMLLMVVFFDCLYGTIYLEEIFDNYITLNGTNWILSEFKNENGDRHYKGGWNLISNPHNITDKSMNLMNDSSYHAVSKKLNSVYVFKDSPLIFQYEVAFRNGWTCSGAYMKLLNFNDELDALNDKSDYTIMFGPDKCSRKKIHFIVKYKNSKHMQQFEEKHSKLEEPTMKLDDGLFHLFRLTLYPHGLFYISIDQSEFFRGNLLTDFVPSFNPPIEIYDTDDRKPDDWDEREMIEDTSASKPDDWDETQPELIEDNKPMPDGWLEDESEYIEDSSSVKPNDWDDSIDGQWKPKLIKNHKCNFGCGPYKKPLIRNPLYKGIWKLPMIKNVDYKGKWTPRKIPNPAYFNDKTPFSSFSPISAISLELWTVDMNISFDNIIVSDNVDEVDNFTIKYWNVKNSIQNPSKPLHVFILNTLLEFCYNHPVIVALTTTIFIIFTGCYLIFKKFFKSENSSEESDGVEIANEDVIATSKNNDQNSSKEELIEEETSTTVGRRRRNILDQAS